MKTRQLTLSDILAPEKKSLISGPFGSDIGKRFFVENGVPVIRGNNLTLDSRKFLDQGFVFVTEEKAKELDAYAVNNDLLFTAAGTIGQVGMIPINAKYLKYVISNKQIRVRLNPKVVDYKFAYYWFSSPWVAKEITNKNTGSTVPLINLTVLRGIGINLPELLTQQKIAAVLSTLDDKIELNNKINEELEAMAKTLYDYWFVQFDFPDANGKSYKSSGGKMVYNEVLKREIPEGWEVKSLFESADVQYGFPFSTNFFNEGFIGNPVIRIRDIKNNSISTFSSEENILEKYLLKKGDVLIGMDGNFHINYWSRENCYLNQRAVKIRKKLLANILMRYQIEPFIQLRERSVSRTTVAHLSDKDLKSINILLPGGKFKDQANDLMNGLLNKIILNNQQNLELSELRDWFLPILMNGQVSVGKAYEEVEGILSVAAEEQTRYINEKT